MRTAMWTIAVGTALAMVSGAMGVAPVAAVHDGTPASQASDLIWANGRLWDTVLLGGLHGNAPAHTLDRLYMIPGQNPVSEAAPGDNDYNGGRWLPTVLAWAGAGEPPLFTDGEQVEASLAAGDLVIAGEGAPFLCPLTNPQAGA